MKIISESEMNFGKFEEYYSSITEKFIASLQIYIASLLDKYSDTSEIGCELSDVKSLRNIRLKCILVVKDAADITWLAGPLAELKNGYSSLEKYGGLRWQL